MKIREAADAVLASTYNCGPAQEAAIMLARWVLELEHKQRFSCVNNTMRMNSGIYFDLADPKACDVDLDDIAIALGNTCRFGGQISDFYSVAEHSVQCAIVAINKMCPREVCKAMLLHDAAEAYIGDIIKPLKGMLKELNVIEQAVESAICQRFFVSFHHEEITRIDHAMLIAERKALFTPDNRKWTREDEAERVNVTFRKWSPKEASRQFKCMASQLGIE